MTVSSEMEQASDVQETDVAWAETIVVSSSQDGDADEGGLDDFDDVDFDDDFDDDFEEEAEDEYGVIGEDSGDEFGLVVGKKDDGDKGTEKAAGKGKDGKEVDDADSDGDGGDDDGDKGDGGGKDGDKDDSKKS